MSYSSKKWWKYLVITGLIAGTMDIAAAIINFYIRTGRTPGPIFKYIASAVVGSERAALGGTKMMAFGLGLHYLVAFLFTLFFFLLYPFIRTWAKNTILNVLVYGIFVFVMMNWVILPMTELKRMPMQWQNMIIDALILIVCIALPIVLGAQQLYRRRAQP